MLLPSYFRYWGKARPSDSSQPDAHLLAYHCLDVAAVATEYLARAHTLRALLRAGFGFGSDEQLQTWTCTWVALHDVGKFSEAFQAQRPDIFKQLRNRAPDARHANARTRHDTLGMLHWQEVLWKSAEVQNWFGPRTHDLLDGVDAWVRSVTGHHGQPPSEGAGFHGNYFHRDDSVAIDEFAHGVRKLFGSTALQLVDEQQIDEFNAASARTSWWLAGMTVLADWIGSNTDYFPYRSGAEPLLPLAEYWPRAREQARVALSKCGVLPSAIPTGISASMLFPGIATLTPLQTWAANVELASEPQIHLLEDVTGAGKTEAAVILAYRIMAAGLADGFFTALPTMATANAMYARVANVYQQLFAGNADLVLAHGSRNFVEEFARTVVASGNVVPDHNQQDETATARCAAWLADSNKRSLLATAGVGTIDQVLLAVLKSKHQSLRVLGLVGKVLIVDEVHACDDYMTRVLQNVLELHARAGGSAILLSATLPNTMKHALLKSYARGRAHKQAPSLLNQSYPLVTSWSASFADAPVQLPLDTRPTLRRTVEVRYESSETTVIEGILDALQRGRCVCWIRNTIKDALAAYERLRPVLPDNCVALFHARFALGDRLEIEQRVIDSFGPTSSGTKRAGQLLIATQVVEQSLDVDFDVVVSDIAPIDRLIQRAGRLMRHARDAAGNKFRAFNAADMRGPPVLWVYGPAWTADPDERWAKASHPGSSAVYSNHAQLWLTAKVLQTAAINIPEDARGMIESVYGDAEIPSGLQPNADKDTGRAYSDKSHATGNSIAFEAGYMSTGTDWWKDGRVPSRLGDPSTEVVLARIQDGALLPWASREHPWAYSRVRVPSRMIDSANKNAVTALGEHLAERLSELEEMLPWSVLLPLELDANGWHGSAMSVQGKASEWRYSPEMGLLLQTD